MKIAGRIALTLIPIGALVVLLGPLTSAEEVTRGAGLWALRIGMIALAVFAVWRLAMWVRLAVRIPANVNRTRELAEQEAARRSGQ